VSHDPSAAAVCRPPSPWTTQGCARGELSIDRTAMVYLIDELEAEALVERARSRQDRRAFSFA